MALLAGTCMFFFYRVLYSLAFCLMLPRLVWIQIFSRKKHNIWRRLFPESIPPIPGDGPLIWVHAVSVGEVYAVAPVVKALQLVKPSARFIISTTTQTGQETAKKVLPNANVHLFIPFDFRWSIRRVLRHEAPSCVLFSEGDLWPVFMDEMKRHGATIAVVNGKISDRTHRLFMRLRFVGRWLYSFVDLFCLQNQIFFDRFCEIGVPQQALYVTGSTKADVVVPVLSMVEKTILQSSIGVSLRDRLIVLGSTHDPEEKSLIHCLEPILKVRPEVKIVVVPRHPERFLEVYNRLREIEPQTALLSTYDDVTPWKILVIDRLGMLTRLYQLATVAIVCGSFIDRIGGHNILEPAAVGVPVLVGPYMHAQPMLYESAKASDAVIQVPIDNLERTILELLNNDELRMQTASKALRWADALRGATEMTVRVLLEHYKI